MFKASFDDYEYFNRNEGDKSVAKFGQTRSVRAVCRAFGSVFHRLLFISFPFPQVYLS